MSSSLLYLRLICKLQVLTLCLVCIPGVHAQRANENVVRSAADAFGSSVGDEEIGLYSANNVRGFSPTAAGNIRVDGIFIDRQSGFSDRLVSGSQIRAGLAAQGYMLPAPTGIADFSLRRVAEEPVQSVILERSRYGGVRVAADLQARLAEGVEAAFGVGYEEDEEGNGTNDIAASVGGNLRFTPKPDADITVFADYVEEIENQFSQRYFTAGPYEPPEVTPLKFVGQPWAEFTGPRYNLGVLANYRPGDWEYRLGVFRSSREWDQQANVLYTAVEPDGSARRRSALGPSTSSSSSSLEARVTRHFYEGSRRHSFTANLRGLDRSREYGGTVGIDLGDADIDEPVYFERPDVEVGEQSQESVEQLTLGFSYDLRWENAGQLNIGIQQSDYSRDVVVPGSKDLADEENPVLYNVNANAPLGERVVIYGGVVRGFEESPVAPISAINQNESPPAAQTQQIDAGARVTFGGLTAVAGIFEIEKPFFGFDEDRFFGEQGMQINRGVELSVAGPVTEELQLVLGTVFYDVILTGDAVDSGALADSPAGALNRSTTLNLDYRPQWAPGWSFDLGLTSRGEQNADSQGLVIIDPYTLLDLGLRRQFSFADNDVVIRGRLTNLFDEFAWNADSTGAYRYIPPRALSVSLRMDI
ncbi:TonB-dependent receptor [Congregibacter sp.]|uniref:TonB-dependent receptor n=1 Tax=Congregibacter sp. TaxID=2744308 RepID=UPI003F6C660D